MKHGIVMRIRKRKAVVLTKDGAFQTISVKKGQHIEIGSEVDVPAPVANYFFSSSGKRAAFSIVAAVVILFVLFSQLSMFTQSNLAVAAYIGVDINPSLEIGVTDKLKVVEVNPINDDGKKIMKQIQEDYQGKSLSEFINDTMELAQKDGYLKENHDVLLTTTMVDKKAESSIEENLHEIKKVIEKNGVAVTTLKGDENTRKEAKDKGISTGKYLIYKKAHDTLTLDETKNLSITQIYDKLEQNQKKSDMKIEKNNKRPNAKNNKNQNEQKWIEKEKLNQSQKNNKNNTKNNDKKYNQNDNANKDKKDESDKKNDGMNVETKQTWENSSTKTIQSVNSGNGNQKFKQEKIGQTFKTDVKEKKGKTESEKVNKEKQNKEKQNKEKPDKAAPYIEKQDNQEYDWNSHPNNQGKWDKNRQEIKSKDKKYDD
ncbi:anti-sigma factor domain-containing protein [Schinkia sp. CFF1]